MDAGDSVPICEGDTLRHDILRLSVRDLSEYPVMNPTEQEYSLTAPAQKWIARDIIEKLCNLVVDCDTELKSTDNGGPASSQKDGNIAEQGYSFSATAEREIDRVVIETFFFMHLDHNTDFKSIAEFGKKKTMKG